MKTDDPGRRFSRDVKLAAVQRMAAGANVSKLSRELGVSRKGLYQWQKQFRVGGASTLRDARRPQQSAAAGPEQPEVGALQPSSSDELLRAIARIAELERLVGQQAADIDFFQKALQHVGTARQRSDKPGGMASTRLSKR